MQSRRKMNIKKALNERSIFYLTLLLGFIILLIPITLRELKHDSILIGETPYYHQRVSQDIMNGDITSRDNMISGTREYLPNPYHFLLAGFGKLFGSNFASKLLPFLLGILTLSFFFILLSEHNLRLFQKMPILLLFILSPVFIYYFTISNEYSLLIFLNILGLFFFNKKNKSFLIAVLLYLLIPLFGAIDALVSILILFNFVKIKRIALRKFLIVLSLILIVHLIYYAPFYFKNGFGDFPAFNKESILKKNISELGSSAGFSTFALILAFLGIIFTWNHKKKIYFFYISLFLLIIISSYFQYLEIYLVFLFSALAGIGFYELTRIKWEIKLIRELSILAIILGILFSSVSYINRIVDSKPDNGIIDGLLWLKYNSNEEDVVFSHYSRGFWIEDIAKRKVVMDGLLRYTPNLYERYEDSNNLFYNRSLKETKKLLNKYNISYIWIDNEMKEGLVWTKEKQGLLFSLRNKEIFKNIYSKGGVEIWRYAVEAND